MLSGRAGHGATRRVAALADKTKKGQAVAVQGLYTPSGRSALAHTFCFDERGNDY